MKRSTPNPRRTLIAQLLRATKQTALENIEPLLQQYAAGYIFVVSFHAISPAEQAQQLAALEAQLGQQTPRILGPDGLPPLED